MAEGKDLGKVKATDRFVQISPNFGVDAPEKTRFWVAFDDDALYVAIDAEQSTQPIAPPLQYDSWRQYGASDWLVVNVDTQKESPRSIYFWRQRGWFTCRWNVRKRWRLRQQLECRLDGKIKSHPYRLECRI